MPILKWKELCDQAILEPDAGKVPERVETARQAIHEYRVSKGKNLTPEEREDIDGALRALFVLLQRRP